jgi:hypothetical protein
MIAGILLMFEPRAAHVQLFIYKTNKYLLHIYITGIKNTSK